MRFHSISPLDYIPPFVQVARRAYLVAKHYIPPMVALTWDPLPAHVDGADTSNLLCVPWEDVAALATLGKSHRGESPILLSAYRGELRALVPLSLGR